MRYLKYFFVCLFWLGLSLPSNAHINPNMQRAPQGNNNSASLREDCAQATSQIDLDINNVRARLLVGGDIWWDGDEGRYVIPKPPPGSNLDPVSSLFAGAVWLGGFDIGGSLKMAAQTYGTASGDSDFWPGPLTTLGTTGSDTCANWDRFFTVKGADIAIHIANWQTAIANGQTQLDPNTINTDILSWPALENPYFFAQAGFELPDRPTQGLAPFFDENMNGRYEPQLGDYPVIDIRGCEEETPQYADDNIFWIYNDNGNIHTETNGEPLSMEIQVQAFAYQTNDEVNDMTFYRYKLINWGIQALDSTFFAMWVDPDLGCFTDDYIGCDTALSMMYVYNSDALDGESSCQDCQGVFTYCTEIPALGVDYFRGPLGPKVFTNGMDASGGLRTPNIGEAADTIVELGMSSFTYYNNGGINPPPPPGTADPGGAAEHYRYLSGSWSDGTRFTFGGDGYNPMSQDIVNYAFTNTPDDVSGWSMAQEGLADGDRRTVQASGPFRLDPGTKNELIIGVVWVPDLDYPAPDISRLQSADEVAQALFDNCFDITDGPDAPDVCFIELDEEIIITLSNEITSNNFEENYAEIDLRAPPSLPDEEKLYRFEGYQVYQLTTPNADFSNPDEARIIYQVDVKNGVGQIFNWDASETSNPIPGGEIIFVPEEMVDGENNGVLRTFRVTEDQFGLDSRNLINHKKYYFSVIAYAHNEWMPFDNTPPGTGQQFPYLVGRRNIGPSPGILGYTVIPRPIVDRKLNAEYGDGPIVTRLEGVGVGGNFLDVSQETREAMVNNQTGGEITYLGGNGPIDVKVYNPLDVVDGEFELTFFDDNNDDELDEGARWRLVNLDDPSFEVISTKTLEEVNEQTIPEYGFSLTVAQTEDAGDLLVGQNGALGFDLSYSDIEGDQWLEALPGDSGFPFNYVGISESPIVDPSRGLTDMASGFFYPYRVLDVNLVTPLITPAWVDNANGNANAQNFLQTLPNVDIVLTSDPTLWSRCVVVETANRFYYEDLALPTEGGAENFDLRGGASLDQNGNEDGTGTGFSYFPGYAVDLETGKRLNIFFGENSTYDCDAFPTLCTDNIVDPAILNGRDMIWNPSNQAVIPELLNQPGIYGFLGGGQHFIYVSNTEYDECATIATQLSGSVFDKLNAVKEIKWAGFPLLAQGSRLLSVADGIVPNDVVVKLRVDNPYREAIGTGENNGLNKYLFSFEGVAPDLADTDDEVKTQLDAINVVPNPYYGFSDYETSQFTNTVKITNLPANCTVTIFTLGGKFVRQYIRNEERLSKGLEEAPVLLDQISPALEWDLNNSKGIPVASGVYLIHVEAEGLGERVIKWFGVARQFDPTGL